MRSRSGIESAFISRSWRSLVQPRMGRQFIAWRRQPQGIPNEPTIILSPRGGGRGNSRQGRRWCRVARADRDSQVSALGVGLPSGAPFRCAHRIAHRKRGPGQQGLRVVRNLLGPQPRRKPDRVEVPNMRWTCCRRCRVARADRDSQVSALGVGLRSGAPFRCTHRIRTGNVDLSQQEPCVAHCPSSCRWLWWLWWLCFYPRPLWLPETTPGACVHDIDDFLGSSPASRSNQSHPSH